MADPTQTRAIPYDRWNLETLTDMKLPPVSGKAINPKFRESYISGQSAVTRLLAHRPNRLEQELSDWRNPTTSVPEMQRRREAFIEEAVRDALRIAPLPPDANLRTWLAGLGHGDATQGVIDYKEAYRNNLKQGAKDQLDKALGNCSKTNFDEPLGVQIEQLNALLHGPNHHNTAEWIQRARTINEQLTPGEIEKLNSKLSLAEQSRTGQNYEFIARNLTMAASTVGAFGLAAYAFATQGIDQAWLTTGVAMMVNAGINLFCCIRHDARFKTLVLDTRKQIEDASSMPAVILWTGVLSHIIDKYNPLLVGRTKSESVGSNTSDTTAAAMQNRLKHVATVALSEFEIKRKEGTASASQFLHKDGKVNGAWSQVKDPIASFTGKWNVTPRLLNFFAINSACISALPACASILKLYQ